MTEKQKILLNKFNQVMLSSPEEKILLGSKYKNGNASLTAHDLNPELWTELVQLGDTPDLWQQADRYLQKL